MAMRDIRVVDFTPTLAEALLKPIWRNKPQLAKDFHCILNQMFERAIDLKLRPDNPFARVKKALGELPEPGEDAAYPWREMPHLMEKVRTFWKDPPFRTDINRQAILDAYAAGMRCRQLSREFHIPYALAQKITRDGKSELIHATMVKRAAFEILILPGLRQENIIGMRWKQLSLAVPGEEKITIPREEMKVKSGHKGRPYESSLSKRVVEILDWVKGATSSVRSDFVFPGLEQGLKTLFRERFRAEHPDFVGYPMGDMSIYKFAKDNFPLADVTIHGFRSSFVDWAEENDYEERLIKLQLDHLRGNAVDRAYARGSLFRARRLMLERWSSFLMGGSAEVIPFTRKASA